MSMLVFDDEVEAIESQEKDGSGEILIVKETVSSLTNSSSNFENNTQLLKKPISPEVINAWADENDITITFKENELTDAYVFNDKIALILNPRGDSSLQLRNLQKSFKEEYNLKLYYTYPWELESAKLLSHFKSKLGLDTRKYAAKRLILEEVSNDVGNKFMKDYHIQGVVGGSGKVNIALMVPETREIVAMQQFSRYRFGITKGKGTVTESPVWEGLRLCFKPGVQIYGGASRLQKYFENTYKPEKIISYINGSHSDGDYKKSQGFVDITDWNQFSYMWVLEGEPKPVPIKDKYGVMRYNDLEKSRKKRFVSPGTVAGAFGAGVGGLFYNGRLGNRKQLREHPENGELVHNDIILEEIGYFRYHTSGQFKWEKNFPKDKKQSE